ncbi:WhiB family transcriptional regulator [Streptomyces sp. NPDC059003]|uniref:WhiB family transcriptional regulator n=1 Tax=Streptomyces sp. NPDC059003 TaxID=3346691 RepID=UPI003683647B
MDWLFQAACRDEDPDLFFPIGRIGPALLQVIEAKRCCARCTVSEQCRGWALATGQESGIWGGLTADELNERRHQDTRGRGRTTVEGTT